MRIGLFIDRGRNSIKSSCFALYKESIDELDRAKAKLWEVMDDKGTTKSIVIMAAATLSKISGQIIQLYDAMPIVQAMQDIELRDQPLVKSNSEEGVPF